MSPTKKKQPFDEPFVRNRARARADRRGFSIVELVVALVIITILVSILVPVVISRSRQARIGAARSDLQSLADALERAAVDTGYYFRLYVLDDRAGGDGIPNEDPLDTFDGTDDIAISIAHSSPTRIFIEPSTGNFTGAGVGSTAPTDLFIRFTSNETAFNWLGPYINWRQDSNFNDWPDDPWGSDYIFFTRSGGLFPATGLPDLEAPPTAGTVPDDQFVIDGPGGILARIFDRPTVLSLGPNRLPGDGTAAARYGTGDDIFVSFGGGG
jgi:prepilin-type N-terminal cleavage/methylation domain-containing protein